MREAEDELLGGGRQLSDKEKEEEAAKLEIEVDVGLQLVQISLPADYISPGLDLTEYYKILSFNI